MKTIKYLLALKWALFYRMCGFPLNNLLVCYPSLYAQACSARQLQVLFIIQSSIEISIIKIFRRYCWKRKKSDILTERILLVWRNYRKHETDAHIYLHQFDRFFPLYQIESRARQIYLLDVIWANTTDEMQLPATIATKNGNFNGNIAKRVSEQQAQ